VLHSTRSLQSCRGAAFLLAVYLSALVLLLMGGVSLQRTQGEVRAASISGNLQQAFWLADAGLDEGLSALREDRSLSTLTARELGVVIGDARYTRFAASDSLMDGTYGPFSTPVGTYTLKVQTSKLEVLGPEGMQLTRAITSTGTAAGREASVTAVTTSETIPLTGVFANGPVLAPGNVTITGSLHTAAGVPGSFMSYWGDSLRIFGDLTVGLPEQDNAYTKLYGGTSWMAARDCCTNYTPGAGSWNVTDQAGYDEAFKGGAAVVLPAALQRGWEPKHTVSGKISAVEMPRIQPIAMPVDLVGAAVPLIVPDGQTVVMNANGVDADEAPIVRLKVQALALGRDSALIFNAPAEIYIEGSLSSSDADTLRDGYWGFSPTGAAIYLGTDSVLVALDPSGLHTLEKGVLLKVTQAPSGSAGAVIADMPWAFYGSLWAPESPAKLAASLAYMTYDWWMDLDEHVKDPGTPGGLKGMKNPYVVVDSLQLGGMAIGCSALVVDKDRQATLGEDGKIEYEMTGWRNTLQGVTPNAPVIVPPDDDD
jgi:hypothetical protein